MEKKNLTLKTRKYFCSKASKGKYPDVERKNSPSI
jgi:hypothetical protein